VIEVDGVGIAVWRARLASGLRWWWSSWRGVIGLGGLCWSGIRCGLWEGRGGGWELGLVDGGWGGIETGSFATLRMTGLWCWSGIRCGLWEGSGGGWELGLVDGGWGGIEAGSFATLRMTGLWCWRGCLWRGCVGAVGEDGAGDV
jgi:hypothetical protein